MDERHEDALDHIIKLCDLEWNGMITLPHFRDRVQSVIEDLNQSEKDNCYACVQGRKYCPTHDGDIQTIINNK